ncbi:MAG: hypothetical protein HY741_25710 [Chloroflexi bacterium]|nr:hypothetical protein [Chloroflexota bacterium]
MLPELKKLGIVAGQKILVHRAPKAFTQELRDQVPPETRVATRHTTRTRYNMIFHFAAPDENFDVLFQDLQHALEANGALWVIIPNQKAAKRLGVQYDWNTMLASALKTTLVDNKTLSFSPDEYGTRFVIPKEHRNASGQETSRQGDK